MRFPKFSFAPILLLAALFGGLPQQAALASTLASEPEWAFENSDIPVDPAFVFGRLENGMRYIVRQNATPEETGLVRMVVESGSLSERDDERGYAHFIEHMAFNGSTHVPEGEMVRLLEREGLAFGADTNASTGFDLTMYKLDLPRNEPGLLDTALMLMRETAGELTFAPEAVDRERGVVLAEMRDRNTYALREIVDRLEFLNPEALYPNRLPIGTVEALNAATSASLRAFWQREYVPANTTLVVIGDFAPELVEAAIRKHFSNWQAAPLPAEPDAGPIDTQRAGDTDIYVDPALSERVTASRHGPWLDEPDTVANRQTELLRQIGYAIVNRRLQRLSRQEDAPFRDAGFGTGDIFEAGRTTNLVVDSGDGEWRDALIAAAVEYRRAMDYGFSEAEVAEQVANVLTVAENAAAGAATRSHSALAGAALRLIDDDIIPSTPQSALERLEAFVPEITPEAVLAALDTEAVPLEDPLLRFRGRNLPEGGVQALRQTWDEAMAMPLAREEDTQLAKFAYTDFGPRGEVVSDMTDERLGIRKIRFANGVRLNLKPTQLERDRIEVELNLDGGKMLDTRENPLATEMFAMLPAGGLGAHSEDELQSILAGKRVSLNLKPDDETFVAQARTTPRDLETQLDLLAAMLTDPGYRAEGGERYRRNIGNFFARKDATPSSALASALDGILSDGDPRFTLQEEADYRALTFEKLRQDIGDRLAHGAVELALVGDFEPERAIDLVARTLGTLPQRESDFRAYTANRQRPFTETRGTRMIRHGGQADQALLHLAWPTRDDAELAETLRLELLEKVMRIELTDSLREKLGKAYSPRARSSLSHYYDGYGVFSITASVDVADIEETRSAISDTLERLRATPIEPDILQRARQPMLESLDNALKTNGGWMHLVDRAQSEADRIDRFLAAKPLLAGLTAADVQTAAQRYLHPDEAVQILVLPEDASTP